MASDPWGGSEELWFELAKTSKSMGMDVSVSFYQWNVIPRPILELKNLGVKTFGRPRISYNELIKKPIGKINQLLFALRKLKKVTSEAKPHHVVISLGGFSDLQVEPYYNYISSLKCGYSLIVHANPEDRYFNLTAIREMNEIVNKAQNVFFVSERLLEIAKRQTGNSFPNSKIILNPISLDDEKDIKFPELSTLNMACVGRLINQVKGQSLLLQLLATDEWRDRNWKLNIYGEGPDKNVLEFLIDKWELKNKVKLHGFVNNIKKDIWGSNHVLIMPSYYEGMPLTLMEAMLCERTAVCTDVGGAKELLTESVGYFADGINLASLGAAMDLMWQDKDNLRRKGKKAKADIVKYIDEFISYEELISNLMHNEN